MKQSANVLKFCDIILVELCLVSLWAALRSWWVTKIETNARDGRVWLREENLIWGEFFFFICQAITIAFLHVKCCYSHFTDERSIVQRGSTVWKKCTQIYAYMYAAPMWGRLALLQVFQILKPNLHLLYLLPLTFSVWYYTYV